MAGATATGAAPEPKEIYLIKFVDSVNFENEMAALKAGGDDVKAEYSSLFKGAAVAMNSARAAALARNPRIEFIEQDGIATTQQVVDGSLWGLDRIDQANRPLNGNYDFQSTGAGVRAYVVDTGIDVSLPEFGGRAVWGKNFTGDGINSDWGGHGTHVAGTIGSNTYGVAKGVSLVAYKVLGCDGSGSYSGIISGLNDIAKTGIKPAVVNMSLGGGKSSALNTAIASLTNAGFVVVVAAGNNGANACNYSPASAPSALTVGATTSTDVRSSFSNFGKCLDIFAPGSAISSVTPGGAVASWNGTSMASPHVAGVAARILSQTPAASVATVTSLILSTASANKVSSAGGQSPNKLLYIDSRN
jgi:subtilisin family serine protease